MWFFIISDNWLQKLIVPEICHKFLIFLEYLSRGSYLVQAHIFNSFWPYLLNKPIQKSALQITKLCIVREYAVQHNIKLYKSLHTTIFGNTSQHNSWLHTKSPAPQFWLCCSNHWHRGPSGTIGFRASCP